ncbi:HisA/HisF-related TIM barrel protein, partial [Clostridioides difficile]|uniref:HisA/HisF-related TIM barrel protein n=1 Tax=Clostridioides difficile TaxID=1496 RepID=UPI002ED45491
MSRCEKWKSRKGKKIEDIANNIDIPIQVGGGVRDKEKVKSLINAGVTRVILGSIAI